MILMSLFTGVFVETSLLRIIRIMKFTSQDAAKSYVLKYCDDDEEAMALLVEQVRYEIPPLPPQDVLDAVNAMIVTGYAFERSVLG